MALVSYNSMRHSSLLYVARSGLAVCMSMSVDGRSWSSTSAEPCSTGWDSYDIGWRGVICNREGGRVTMIDCNRMSVLVASIRGNVSGWDVLTEAQIMCVHQRSSTLLPQACVDYLLIGEGRCADSCTVLTSPAATPWRPPRARAAQGLLT